MYSLVYWLTVVIATAFLFIMCAGYLVICAGFLVKLFQKRNFKFGEPWGLFAKTNRSATRASTIRQGMVGAFMGAAFYWTMVYFRDWSVSNWLAKSIFFAVFLGLIAALCEWQIDDSLDDDMPNDRPATRC